MVSTGSLIVCLGEYPKRIVLLHLVRYSYSIKIIIVSSSYLIDFVGGLLFTLWQNLEENSTMKPSVHPPYVLLP